MEEKIFNISPDKERAKSLLEMSRERIELINLIPKDKVFKIIEDYYEIIKELLTAIMYSDGKKTLSHVALIDYFKKNYSELDDKQIQITDNLRKSRHGVVYYGRKITEGFLINNEQEIKDIIKILTKKLDNKLL